MTFIERFVKAFLSLTAPVNQRRCTERHPSIHISPQILNFLFLFFFYPQLSIGSCLLYEPGLTTAEQTCRNFYLNIGCDAQISLSKDTRQLPCGDPRVTFCHEIVTLPLPYSARYLATVYLGGHNHFLTGYLSILPTSQIYHPHGSKRD